MNGACEAIPLELESGRHVPGINISWEVVPANDVDPLEPVIDEVDLREYFVEVFEVEDMTAFGGPRHLAVRMQSDDASAQCT